MLYEQYGWIENSQATAAQSYFVRDLTDRNRLNCRLQYNRIGNLMVEAVSLEFQA
jgi:phage tail sheath gpL-like